MARQLHLGAFMRPVSIHTGAWRYPGAWPFVGTPASIANEMEAWLEERASDEFNIMFPWLPGGLDAFATGVVPELQRRGPFRREYAGTTLRDHLGLPRLENRFFVDSGRQLAAE